MPGSGVAVNVLAVLAGSAVGLLFGRLIAERFRTIAFSAIGLATVVIGASMSIGGLAGLGQSAAGPYAALVLVGALVVGSLLGEAMRIEHRLERFGFVLQRAAHRMPVLAPGRAEQPGEKAHTLVEGFVTASLLYCVGAMAILGSIQDGLGDPSLLYLKSLLDGTASVALATTLGAHSIEPYVTAAVIDAIQATGGALILAIGLDLAGIKRLPVGNMLPAIVIAALVMVALA